LISSHTAIKPERHLLKNLALLLITFTLIAGGVAYGWVDAIDVNIHKHFQSIENAKSALSQPAGYGEPVNLLILGSDKRYREKDDPGRSDTLMILHIDFNKKKVYLVSIPRDSRVNIPRYGMNKINAAYAFGGPRLSISTVEDFTDLKINHYVQIDFRGFKQMVDALGGIDVDVKETINNRSRQYRMYIPKGTQRMDGELALNYVRYRHGDSDFKRAERQQNFLTALTSNVLRWKSAWKIPRLIGIMSKNVETDLTMGQMSRIGGFVRQVKKKNIETITVPGSTGMRNGASYVFPNEAAVNAIVATMKKGGSFDKLKSQIESGKINSVVKKARITILNGTGVSGLAGRTKVKLKKKGFRIVRVGTASKSNYVNTEILVSSGNLGTAKSLKRYLPGTTKIKISKNGLSGIIVVLGKDYTASKGYID